MSFFFFYSIREQEGEQVLPGGIVNSRRREEV
jgi:hypothetical protein